MPCLGLLCCRLLFLALCLNLLLLVDPLLLTVIQFQWTPQHSAYHSKCFAQKSDYRPSAACFHRFFRYRCSRSSRTFSRYRRRGCSRARCGPEHCWRFFRNNYSSLFEDDARTIWAMAVRIVQTCGIVVSENVLVERLRIGQISIGNRNWDR